VARDPLRQTGLASGLRDGLLDERFVDVVPALLAGPRVHPAMLLWKHGLPAPLAICIWILAGQGVRQLHAAVAVGQVLLVNCVDSLEMFLQGASDRLWHHRRTILVFLAFADRDLAALEIEILDPQVKRFGQSQAAAVQEHRDEPFVAPQTQHDPRHLINRQNNRESLGTARPNDALNAGERLLQDLLVEKQERGQCLFLSGSRDMFLNGQASQEPVDIAFRQSPGMLVPVEFDVPAYPVNVRFLRAAAVVSEPQNFNNPVVQSRRRTIHEQAKRSRANSGCGRHQISSTTLVQESLQTSFSQFKDGRSIVGFGRCLRTRT